MKKLDIILQRLSARVENFEMVSANTDKGGIAGLGHEQDDLTEEALDLHASLGVDTSLDKGNDVIYHSVSSISNSGPIEFLIPRDEECCFILDQTRLFGHFTVTKGSDASNVEATDKVFWLIIMPVTCFLKRKCT